jgi:hypothetical protein
MELSGQLHAHAALPPPVPIGQEAREAPEQVWTLWRNRILAVKPVAIVAKLMYNSGGAVIITLY